MTWIDKLLIGTLSVVLVNIALVTTAHLLCGGAIVRTTSFCVALIVVLTHSFYFLYTAAINQKLERKKLDDPPTRYQGESDEKKSLIWQGEITSTDATKFNYLVSSKNDSADLELGSIPMPTISGDSGSGL